MKTVLSTKTLDSAMLDFARTQNLHVECMDFIETTAVTFDTKEINHTNFDAVAFTSANAVKYFFLSGNAQAVITGKQIFALMGRTKDALLARGITANFTAPSADELAGIIIAAKSTKGILHVCGNLKLPVLEDRLKSAGVAYRALVVYKTIGRSDNKVTGVFDAVLFYSPSGVESFFAENNIDNKTVCCCIGTTTAQALKERKEPINIILPNEPSPQAMLTMVANYFKGN